MVRRTRLKGGSKPYRLMFRLPKSRSWKVQSHHSSMKEAKESLLDEVLVREPIRAKKIPGSPPSYWRIKKVD